MNEVLRKSLRKPSRLVKRYEAPSYPNWGSEEDFRSNYLDWLDKNVLMKDPLETFVSSILTIVEQENHALQYNNNISFDIRVKAEWFPTTLVRMLCTAEVHKSQDNVSIFFHSGDLLMPEGPVFQATREFTELNLLPVTYKALWDNLEAYIDGKLSTPETSSFEGWNYEKGLEDSQGRLQKVRDQLNGPENHT